MKIISRIICTLAVLTLLISLSIPNAGAFVKEKSLSDLTIDSDSIITGKVIDKKSYWEDGNIFTDITVSADRHIKGRSDSQFRVKVPGGTVGNIHSEVSDTPQFGENEEVLVFLRENNVVGWNQGKYTIENDKIRETGESVDNFVNNIKNSVTMPAVILPMPHIVDITPKSGPAKAEQLGSSVASSDSTVVTITGIAFGSNAGSVALWRGGTTQYDATIVSWEDTKIVAKIPGRVSSYSKSDNTGNVQVTTSGGVKSDNYGNFGVTYSYGGGKWSGRNVTYFVNANTADTTGELEAVNAAAGTWNNAGANFGLVYGGTTAKKSSAIEGEYSIMWVNYDTASVATTITWWYTTDPKTIVECDIVFNDLNNNWGTDKSPTKMDVQTVATHELGHWIQLLDLYGSTDYKKMMYGYVSDGEIRRTLSVDDIDGIKAVYGSTIISGDILKYYRGLGQNSSTVETGDLLKAADDWRNNAIPKGFSVSITTSQLLVLADEWRVS